MDSPLQRPPRSNSGALSLNIFYQQPGGLRFVITNCRSIEVEVYINGASPTPSCSAISAEATNPHGSTQTSGTQHMDMNATADLPSSRDQPFPFLSLPFELRLKIYTLLLPPRTHKISTQIPSNGYYYSTLTLPSNPTQSFYPFGRQPPSNLTTYKVLNKNLSRDSPNKSIFPEILRTCRRVKQEGESVLYGGYGVQFEFGEVACDDGNGEAMRAFFMDRGQGARECVRRVSIARELSPLLHSTMVLTIADEWEKTCTFMKNELTGLSELNLMIWSANGKSLVGNHPVTEGQNDKYSEYWRLEDWEWIKEFIDMEGLREARVTWWDFQEAEEEGKESSFDSWVARRMVGDRVVRERMIRDGKVIEGVAVLPGAGSRGA